MQQSQAEFVDFESSTQGGLNFKPLLRLVKRYALLITSITAAFGVLAYLKTASEPPRYSAGFQVLVEPATAEAQLTDPSNLARNERNIRGGTLDYDTQLEILQSPEMLDGIASQVQADFPGFSMGQLRQGLTVEREGGTKILSVSYEDGNPVLVQRVADEIARTYQQYSLEQRKTRLGEGVRFIESQLPEMQARVNFFQQELQQLQQANGIVDPNSEATRITTELQNATAQRQEAEILLREQQVLYDNLQRQLELSPTEAIAASALSEDPIYQNLLAELQIVENEIAAESVRFSLASPPIQSLMQRRDNLTVLLEAQAQRVVGPQMAAATLNPQVRAYHNSIRQNLTQQMVDAANQIQALETRRQGVAQVQGTLEQQLQQFPSIARQYNDLERQLDLATRTLDQLLTQRELLRVEAAQNDIPWELISEPSVPVDENGNYVPEPSSLKWLVLGIAAGLFSGIMAAYLFDRALNVFHSEDELQDQFDQPLLGLIPYNHTVARFNQQGWITPQDIASQDRARVAQFLESFSELYASIRYISDDPPIKSIVISSAQPEDGKSTIALNLARVIATTDKRVLLIDANLRRPQVHRLLNLPNAKGLGDVLNGTLDPMEVIQRSPEAANLFVMTAGTITSNSPRMMASTRMEQLSQRLNSEFDYVIYDTPHLVGVMDAIFLAAYTDGIIMTVSQNRTKRTAVDQALNELEKYSIPTLGLVFNRVRQRQSVEGYEEMPPDMVPEPTLQTAGRPGAPQLISPVSNTEIQPDGRSTIERSPQND
jgi:succinoglycan biosynthesis transport protein ExoP